MLIHVHLTSGTVITLDADSAEVTQFNDGRVRSFSYTTRGGRFELYYLPPDMIAAVVSEVGPKNRPEDFTFTAAVRRHE